MKRMKHFYFNSEGQIQEQDAVAVQKLIESGDSEAVKAYFTSSCAMSFLERNNGITEFATLSSRDADRIQNVINGPFKDSTGKTWHEAWTIVRSGISGMVLVPEKLEYVDFFSKLGIKVNIKHESHLVKLGKRIKRLFAPTYGWIREGTVTSIETVQADGRDVTRMTVHIPRYDTNLTVDVVPETAMTDGMNLISWEGRRKLRLHNTADQIVGVNPLGYVKGLLGTSDKKPGEADITLIGQKPEVQSIGDLFYLASMVMLKPKSGAYTDVISVTNFSGMQDQILRWAELRRKAIYDEVRDENLARRKFEEIALNSGGPVADVPLANPSSEEIEDCDSSEAKPTGYKSDTWPVTRLLRWQAQTGYNFPITTIPAIVSRMARSYKLELDNMCMRGEFRGTEFDTKTFRVAIPEDECVSGYLCPEIPAVINGLVHPELALLEDHEAFCAGRSGHAHVYRRPNAMPKSFIEKDLVSLDEINRRIEERYEEDPGYIKKLKKQWRRLARQPWFMLSAKSEESRKVDFAALDGADNDDLVVGLFGIENFSPASTTYPAETPLPEQKQLVRKSDVKGTVHNPLTRSAVARTVALMSKNISIGVLVNPTVVFNSLISLGKPAPDLTTLAYNQERHIDAVNKDGGQDRSIQHHITNFWLTVPEVPRYLASRCPEHLMFNGVSDTTENWRRLSGLKPIRSMMDEPIAQFDTKIDQIIDELREKSKSFDLEVITLQRAICETLRGGKVAWFQAVLNFAAKSLGQEIQTRILVRKVKDYLAAMRKEELDRAMSHAQNKMEETGQFRDLTNSEVDHVIRPLAYQEANARVADYFRKNKNVQQSAEIIAVLLRDAYLHHSFDRRDGKNNPVISACPDSWIWAGAMLDVTLDALAHLFKQMGYKPEEDQAIETPKPSVSFFVKLKDMDPDEMVEVRTNAIQSTEGLLVYYPGATGADGVYRDRRFVLYYKDEDTLHPVGRVSQEQEKRFVTWTGRQFKCKIQQKSDTLLEAVVPDFVEALPQSHQYTPVSAL